MGKIHCRPIYGADGITTKQALAEIHQSKIKAGRTVLGLI